MKVGEIADELGVTPRMIKNYKKDLEDADIYIGSDLGRYGGYYLESYMNLEGLYMTEEEIDSLKRASEVIRNGNYHYSSDFDTLTSKILNEKNNFKDICYYSKGVAPIVGKKEKEVWQDINKAIIKKKKLKIGYKAIGKSQSNIEERTIRPYGLCDHKGTAYVYGYCELRKDNRTFKICRILNHEILKDNFTISKKINFREMMNDSFGIYNDEPIALKLKIHYPMSQIVKEKIYSKNQKIEDIDDQTISFEARMRGYTEIKRWVMGMGSLAEVIKPIKLKEDIKNEAKKVFEAYNKV